MNITSILEQLNKATSWPHTYDTDSEESALVLQALLTGLQTFLPEKERTTIVRDYQKVIIPFEAFIRLTKIPNSLHLYEWTSTEEVNTLLKNMNKMDKENTQTKKKLAQLRHYIKKQIDDLLETEKDIQWYNVQVEGEDISLTGLKYWLESDSKFPFDNFTLVIDKEKQKKSYEQLLTRLVKSSNYLIKNYAGIQNVKMIIEMYIKSILNKRAEEFEGLLQKTLPELIKEKKRKQLNEEIQHSLKEQSVEERAELDNWFLENVIKWPSFKDKKIEITHQKKDSKSEDLKKISPEDILITFADQKSEPDQKAAQEFLDWLKETEISIGDMTTASVTNDKGTYPGYQLTQEQLIILLSHLVEKAKEEQNFIPEITVLEKIQTLLFAEFTEIATLDILFFIGELKLKKPDARLATLISLLQELGENADSIVRANLKALFFICKMNTVDISPIEFLKNLTEVHKSLKIGTLFADPKDFFQPIHLFLHTKDWPEYFALFDLKQLMNSHFIRIGFEMLSSSKEQCKAFYDFLQDRLEFKVDMFKNQWSDVIRIWRTLPAKEQEKFLSYLQANVDEKALGIIFDIVTDKSERKVIGKQLFDANILQKVQWTKMDEKALGTIFDIVADKSERKVISKQLFDANILQKVQWTKMDILKKYYQCLSSENCLSLTKSLPEEVWSILLSTDDNLDELRNMLFDDQQIGKEIVYWLFEKKWLNDIDLKNSEVLRFLPIENLKSFIQRRKMDLKDFLVDENNASSFLAQIDKKNRQQIAHYLFENKYLDNIQLKHDSLLGALLDYLPPNDAEAIIERYKEDLKKLLIDDEYAHQLLLLLYNEGKTKQLAHYLFCNGFLDEINLKGCLGTGYLLRCLPLDDFNVFIQKHNKDLKKLLVDDKHKKDLLLSVRDKEKVQQITDLLYPVLNETKKVTNFSSNTLFSEIKQNKENSLDYPENNETDNKFKKE